MIDVFNFNFKDSKRGFIELDGRDAYSFLNGLITNDVNKLQTSNQVIYTCLLTSQGKYECDFFIFTFQEKLIIDCLQAHLPILIQKFKIYKLRSEFTINDVSTLWSVKLISHQQDSSLCFQDPRHNALGFRLYNDQSCDHHEQVNHNEIAESQLDSHINFKFLRISLGIPCYPASLIPNKTIPLEANMDELNAIAWDKGCYLGQELTARTKYRGMINKRYLPVVVDNGTPEIGWEIQYKDEKIGTLLEFDQTVGIARISIDIALQIVKRGDSMTQKYCSLKPKIPDWLDLY